MKRAERRVKTARQSWGKVVAVSSFIGIFFITVVMRCTGVLYVSWQISFDSSAAQTGAIASIITSTSYCTCVLCNRYGCRCTCILGGVLTFFPMLMSFWATSLWSMYAIAFFTGAGLSCSFLATLVVVANYFKKYYAIVSGFTLAGISINMIVFPPLLRVILDAYGWRGAMLVTSAICANVCVVGALYRPLRNTKPPKRCNKSTGDTRIDPTTDGSSSEDSPSDSQGQYGPATSTAELEGMCVASVAFLRRVFSELRFGLLLKSYRFSLLCLTGVQLQMTYSCVTVYIVPRAMFSGIDDMNAAFLLSIFGFGNLGSRVASGFFVTRKTPVEALYTFSYLICCIGLLCSQVETYRAYTASACIIGVGVGANKVWSCILIRKLLGLPQVASGQAIYLLSCGVGDILGPVVAGLLYDSTGSFSTVFYVLAGLVTAAALQMLLMPVLRRIEPGVAEKETSSASFS